MQTQAVLTLLINANLKTFIDDTIPLCNFKFRKKKCTLLTKDILPKFSEVKVFHERVSCVKNQT